MNGFVECVKSRDSTISVSGTEQATHYARILPFDNRERKYEGGSKLKLLTGPRGDFEQSVVLLTRSQATEICGNPPPNWRDDQKLAELSDYEFLNDENLRTYSPAALDINLRLPKLK